MSISGRAAFEYPSMNLLLKFINPKKLWTNFTSYSVGYSAMALIFSGLMRMPVVLTTNPRNSTNSLWNSYFSGLRSNLACDRQVRTSYTCWIYASLVLE